MRVSPVLVCLCLAGGVLAAAPSSAAAAAKPCTRYAATPELVRGGDDNNPDLVRTAASAVSCPSDVWVQITACLQIQGAGGWSDVQCATSPRTRITPYTRGARGEGISFDAPCVVGVLRTHVTGGEGLEPTEWDSAPASIACYVHDVPADTTPPSATILSGPSGLSRDASPSFSFASSEAGSTFECRLDAPGWTACTSPAAFASLPDGAYTFRVRATDPARNVGTEATRTFTIDTTRPDPAIEPGPPAATPAPTPTAAPEPAPAAPAAPLAVTARDTTSPAIAIPAHRRALTVSRAGVVEVLLGTPQEDASGTLTLRAGAVLGRTSFTARAGQALVARVRLSRTGSAALRRHRRLAVRAGVTLRDAAGNSSVTTFAFALKA